MAFRRGFINAAQFDALIAKTPNCEYSELSQRVTAEKTNHVKTDLP